MPAVDKLEKIVTLRRHGYNAELLYNAKTGHQIITLWKTKKDNSLDHEQIELTAEEIAPLIIPNPDKVFVDKLRKELCNIDSPVCQTIGDMLRWYVYGNKKGVKK